MFFVFVLYQYKKQKKNGKSIIDQDVVKYFRKNETKKKDEKILCDIKL